MTAPKKKDRVSKIDHFFITHRPKLGLKVFFPYHIVWAFAKILWMLWHLVKDDAHKMQYNPATQWKYHLRASWFWVANFPVIAILYFGFPHQWISLGLLVNTFYSLYANFDTEFGAIPASYAAMNAEKLLAAAGGEPGVDVTMAHVEGASPAIVHPSGVPDPE